MKKDFNFLLLSSILFLLIVPMALDLSANAQVGPGPPTNLTATAASSSEIDLSWDAPSNLGSLIITGYAIERSTDGGSTWSTIQSNTGSTETTYSDTGLAHSTTYTYRVSAITLLFPGPESNTSSATTFDLAPSSPTGLVAATTSSSQINLSWTAPSDNGGSAITGYKIQRSSNDGSTWSTIRQNTGSTGTTYSDTGLSPNTTYTYRVFAINSVGASSPSNTASATTQSATTAPSSPTGLAATAGSSQISLSWSAPSSNGGSPITGYDIYRGTTAGGEGTTAIATTSGSTLTYTDTGLANGQTYFYTITAVNSVGESTSSNEASATPQGSPQSPTGLAATASSTSQINLGWTAPANNGGSQITGYKIERSSNGGNAWSTIQSDTGSTATTYSDTGLAASTTYTYRVSAINSVGTSSPSNTASATTQSAITAPSAPMGLAATSGASKTSLSWNAPSNNGGSSITGYNIYRGTASGGEGTTSIGTVSGSTLSYTDIGLTNGKTYYYTVTAVNSAGESMQSNEASATPRGSPQPPTGLAASAISSSQINLSWTAPSSNGGSAITGYKIERSTDGGTTWSTIVSNTGSTTTTYSDTGLNPSTTYTYRVSAINSVGTSSPSNTTSATTQSPQYFITLSKPGLVVSDSLTNETDTQQQLQSNSKYWIYGGDASGENAPYTFWRDTQGVHTGVQAPSNATWAGIYGVTQNNNAMLFHSVVTTPLQTMPANGVYYEPGMYVQTNGSQNVNYVTCISSTSSFGTVWGIFSATGNPFGATNFNLLWYDSSPNQPLTRDCTLITNGNNYLKAYLDGKLVYENTTLNLQMPKPFMVFLESQSSYAGQLLNATYTDYYATTGENVTVSNLPSNAARVDIADGSGNVLATSQASSGTATLDVGQYHFPLAGTIKIYDSNNVLIASSSASIYGGNVYSVSTSSGTSSTTQNSTSDTSVALNNVQSTSGTTSSSNQITLSNFNVGTGNNRLLVVGVEANNNNVASVTFGGVNLAKAISSFHNNDAEFWYMTNPSGTGNIVVTMAGSTPSVVGAYAFSGVDQANPVPTSTTNHNSAASSPTVSITTQYPNSWVLDLPAIYGGVTLGSPTCTQQWDTNIAGAVTGASSSMVQASPGSVTCSWTASGGGDMWDDAAIEIKASQ